MSYQLIKNLLFQLDPETSHYFAMNSMKCANKLGLLSCFAPKFRENKKQVFGLDFPNRIGLAAGFDKNADYIDELGKLGFGHIEVGTITPRPQPGNPKPRLFRLKEHSAIINRMGFNNKGVDHLVKNVQKRKYQGILGVNIGKNFDTPIESAEEDYLMCYKKVYQYSDYIAVNVSSPNTENLRKLQEEDSLTKLLTLILEEKEKLTKEYSRDVPTLVKIAPDLTPEQISAIAKLTSELKLDGVIATNTTISRDAVAGHKHADEKGGLSGVPLFEMSKNLIGQLRQELDSKIPIIGVGGVMSKDNAQQIIDAGAELVQMYTGFIYQGPKLVSEIAEL